MNKDRRQRIQKLSKQLAEISAALEDLRDEEQDAFDGMPENLQQSERGETMEAAISVLDETISCNLETIETLQGALD